MPYSHFGVYIVVKVWKTFLRCPSNYITKVEVQEDRSEALQPMLRHGVFCRDSPNNVRPGLWCIKVGLVQIAHNAARVVLQQTVTVAHEELVHCWVQRIAIQHLIL